VTVTNVNMWTIVGFAVAALVGVLWEWLLTVRGRGVRR
jgi:hypothetical protein